MRRKRSGKAQATAEKRQMKFFKIYIDRAYPMAPTLSPALRALSDNYKKTTYFGVCAW